MWLVHHRSSPECQQLHWDAGHKKECRQTKKKAKKKAKKDAKKKQKAKDIEEVD